MSSRLHHSSLVKDVDDASVHDRCEAMGDQCPVLPAVRVQKRPNQYCSAQDSVELANSFHFTRAFAFAAITNTGCTGEPR